jgi:hypothetical protein
MVGLGVQPEHIADVRSRSSCDRKRLIKIAVGIGVAAAAVALILRARSKSAHEIEAA